MSSSFSSSRSTSTHSTYGWKGFHIPCPHRASLLVTRHQRPSTRWLAWHTLSLAGEWVMWTQVLQEGRTLSMVKDISFHSQHHQLSGTLLKIRGLSFPIVFDRHLISWELDVNLPRVDNSKNSQNLVIRVISKAKFKSAMKTNFHLSLYFSLFNLKKCASIFQWKFIHLYLKIYQRNRSYTDPERPDGFNSLKNYFRRDFFKNNIKKN